MNRHRTQVEGTPKPAPGSSVPAWRKRVAGVTLTLLAAVSVATFWPHAQTAEVLAASSHTLHEAAPQTSTVIDPDAATDAVIGDAKEISLTSVASQPTSDDPATRDPKKLKGARGDIAPDQTMTDPDAAVGGCLAEYGAAGQCLSVVPPSQAEHVQAMTDAGVDVSRMEHPWSCSEVRLYFKTGIAVREKGVDPQRLDSDRNGTACSKKDR